jgi:hypothetical protein
MIDDVKLDLDIRGKPGGDGSTPDEIEIMEGRKRRGRFYDKPFQKGVDIIGSRDTRLRAC